MDDALSRRWAELAPLLDQVLPLTQAQRGEWLQTHGADPELRALIERLLRADAHAADALEASCEQLRDEDEADAGHEPASAPSIAGYRVLRFLGSGGMASVFLAERELTGTTQRVALKLLRLNVHNPHERRLFQREQAALARLEHAHIARLVDAGFAADGAPWLALEYVEGENLLTWCDARALDPRRRARLFLDVCAAVTAAHQALIVHRDLKPGNVLVREDGTVKLVDFGIAKLLESDGDATRTELRRLTPGYAAPEQFRGEVVGTGADVYALGVMLAELLSGERPQLHPDGSITRLVTRRIGAAQAAARGLELRSLRRLLRGDPEAIVARALRAQPRDRYASVEALAADVQAWLEHRPVAARRGTRRYRIACLLRRHRLAFALGLAAALALLMATGVSLHLARRAEQAATQARDEAQHARRVQDFVMGMFRSGEQGIAEGRASSAAELVERALRVARLEFSTQPDSLVPLLTIVGELERSLGRNERSLALLTEAADQAQRELGAANPMALQAEAELGHTRFRAGDYAAAHQRLDAALTRYRVGAGAPNEAVVASLSRLSMLEQQLGKDTEALGHLREAVDLGGRIYAGDHPDLHRVVEIYGGALAESGDSAAAAVVLTNNLAMARRLYGDHHIAVASALESLAVVDTHLDRLDQAASAMREAEQIMRASAPAAHIVTAYVANTQGVVELRRGNSDAARAAFQRALEVYRALHGRNHPMTAATLANLGQAARELADPAAAAGYFREALEINRLVRPPGDFRSASLGCLLASALAEQRAANAGTEFAAAISQFEQMQDVPYAQMAECIGLAAQAELIRGENQAALDLARHSLALLKLAPSRDGSSAVRAHSVAARAALVLGNTAAVSTHLAAALALTAPAHSPHQSARAWDALAACANALQDADSAAAARNRAVVLRR